ncbi:MAG: NAD(P)H-dependent oxidoreductase [bacterium]
MKKIFIVICNQKNESQKAPYVEAYIEEAQKAGNEVRSINLYDIEIDYLKFNNNDADYSLTEELKQAQNNIVWADQIVFVYPIWWLAIPAKLKSFIERIFQEGIIVNVGKFGPEPLLKGKTVVIMQSYYMPYLGMKYLYGDIPFKYLKVILSSWCGLKIEKRFDFDLISNVSEKKQRNWIKSIKKFAGKIR